ncbi:MAG: mechanosensitive ion channel, partial [Bacteroidetes bacterium]|nr:mechanosensitive ion channel [Bacteroidota bacterium]
YDKSGTVEYIGIKTTRIRSLGGEQLIMSNTDLTDSRVQNYKRLEQRRIAYSIRVSNKTPEEKLKKIPGMIKSIIQSQELLKFDRAHFSMFAESYFNFEYVYFVLSADYNMYMDKQQEINLAIVASFRAEQIEFAYPAQQVYISSSPSTAL